jgi:segregation and condensation protein A
MYRIKLPNFDGPFDLLLYFIKRDEINIYDIPIALITDEFLKYVRLIQMLDFELAGEFILMAATLLYIKAQMLLPRDEDDSKSDLEDPRMQLVQRLIEYKQFKDAADTLRHYSEDNRFVLYMSEPNKDNLNIENMLEVEYKNASIVDLFTIFQKIISKTEQVEVSHLIKLFPVTTEEKVELISNSLLTASRLSFIALIHGKGRQHIVATFLAILEMLKRGRISIVQSELFDDIIITRPEPQSIVPDIQGEMFDESVKVDIVNSTIANVTKIESERLN